VNDALLLTAIAAATVLATGVGALPVIALGASRARAAQGVLSGLAAGSRGGCRDRRPARARAAARRCLGDSRASRSC
jgi:hypothetical protein